ncbi:MAG: RC-LH1 core complex protein PufX [Pseudomonadota bacterium]
MVNEEKWYLKDEKKPSLARWIFEQQAIGAVYAALVLAAVIFFILFFKGVAAILPEDPFAALELGKAALGAIV